MKQKVPGPAVDHNTLDSFSSATDHGVHNSTSREALLILPLRIDEMLKK